jgi:hypothetical protein
MRLLSFHYGLLNCLHGCYVVWLTELIGDVLGVDDAVVAIKHEDGPLEQTPLFEPHSIVLAELLTTLGRERLVERACAVKSPFPTEAHCQ